MRNTRDWYIFIDRLVTSGKQLYLYLENRFYNKDDALITGIKAILAEEYSRELSRKINNAHRNRQKTGSALMLTSNTYGFWKMPDKSLALVEEEAAVKRKMYELCRHIPDILVQVLMESGSLFLLYPFYETGLLHRKSLDDRLSGTGFSHNLPVLQIFFFHRIPLYKTDDPHWL